MITAQQIKIELETNREIADGTILKGTLKVNGAVEVKLVAWLKKSQYPSAEYYFFINEDVPKGERGQQFTPKPASVKNGRNGLYADGLIFEYKGLKFPISGNVDFDNETKTIVLGLGSEKSRVYGKEKGYNYILEASDNEESIPF